MAQHAWFCTRGKLFNCPIVAIVRASAERPVMFVLRVCRFTQKSPTRNRTLAGPHRAIRPPSEHSFSICRPIRPSLAHGVAHQLKTTPLFARAADTRFHIKLDTCYACVRAACYPDNDRSDMRVSV